MINAVDANGGFALEAQGLEALRRQAREDPQQALKGAARQFEAVFLQALLKSMRDAGAQDGPMDSEQTRMYTAMLDQQLAQSLSRRGAGLADIMEKQLARSPFAIRDLQAPPDPDPVTPAPAASAKPGVQRSAAGVADGDFLSRMKEDALEASRATGIPARFLLGQAALESGWGRREIRAADGGRSFNLFGIKAGRNWNGPTVEVMTTEYIDGAPRRVLQKFRAYGSYAEAFRDYAGLMRGNPRYAAVLRQGDDAAGFAQSLQRAGYATDPLYAQKLTRILSGPRMRQTFTA